MAGLKPLANFKVWGALGIIGIIGVSLWQYTTHPEWFDGSTPQPPSVGDVGEDFGENFEEEVAYNLDIGVNANDFENIAPPLEGMSPKPIPIGNPFRSSQGEDSILGDQQGGGLSQSSVGNNAGEDSNEDDKGERGVTLGFQPLMPNFEQKELSSLFPSLQPSQKGRKPLQIPALEPLKITTPQNHALKQALENLQRTPSRVPPETDNPSLPSSIRESQQTNRGNTRGNGSPSQSSSTPYYNPYGQGNVYSVPRNTSGSYPSANNNQPLNNQPYTNPYGNGMAPAPIPTYPPSSRPGNNNVNQNSPNQTNSRRQTPQYGMQPAQVNQYEGFGY